MNNRRILILLLIGLMPAGMAWADLTNTADSSPDLFKEHQYEIAPEFSYIAYHEPGSVREKGPFYGIYGAYDWRPQEAQNWIVNVVHFDSHFNFGLVDYKSPDGEVNNIDDYMGEPRAWVGRDFSPFDYTRLTPYLGFGYRFLYDHFGAASDDGGYDRTSQYLYAPVGFEIENESVPGWQFGFNAEYDIFIEGWQESYFSNINGAYPNVNNKQDGGYGVRSSVDIIKKMGRINILLSPYIRYWNIRQSKTATGVNPSSGEGLTGYEPKNDSTEVGAKIGVQF